MPFMLSIRLSEAKKEESKHPDRLSLAMPMQGISTRLRPHRRSLTAESVVNLSGRTLPNILLFRGRPLVEMP